MANATGLALCALAASSVLAFAQEPGTKGGHQEEAKPNTGPPSSNGPPGTINIGRFLIGDGAPDIEGRDQANMRYHLTEERRDKTQLVVFARTPQEVRGVDATLRELEDLGIGVIAIAPFRQDRVGAINLRLITDGASINARNYGAFDHVTSNPRSSIFLIDHAGKIQMMMSGGIPVDGELVRLTRESLEKSGELVASPPPALN